MKKTIVVSLAALTAILLVACGGKSGAPAAPPSVPTTAPAAPTAVATTIPTTAADPVTPNEAWARSIVLPREKEVHDLLLAQDWSALYDSVPAEDRVGCSRTVFVSKMASFWITVTMFGADKTLEAEAQDLKDGTLPITFSEITTNRITYTVGTEDPQTIYLKDGEWSSGETLGQDCSSLDMDWDTSTPTP